MFYEFTSTDREAFKFPYKGSELLLAAMSRRDLYREAEMEAREQMAVLMRDPNVSQSDERIQTTKKRIESHGKQAEACSVFVVGFRREPDRIFRLAIGDVVYFGLNHVDTAPDIG